MCHVILGTPGNLSTRHRVANVISSVPSLESQIDVYGCRSLRYLHNRELKTRGCVNRVETETDLYHGLRGPDNTSSW